MQVPKPNHKRMKPKRRNVTKITSKAREEVLRRSKQSCECCGRSRAYAFEVAHLKSASQGGSGSNPANLALLCGPSVNSGTCHHWADSTKDGRKWRYFMRMKLEEYYGKY